MPNLHTLNGDKCFKVEVETYTLLTTIERYKFKNTSTKFLQKKKMHILPDEPDFSMHIEIDIKKSR
jgi:hypothetical protein